MSHSILNAARGRGRRRAALAGAAALSALLLAAGCAKRDSITVGSVPDDYRTNHPIAISEREVAVDIPVGLNDYRLNNIQRTVIDGFISRYDRSEAPMVTVLVPSGSPNQIAASNVAAGLVQRMRAAGVPEGRILHQPYQAAAQGDAAPIRVSYLAMKASTGKCGRWPDDLLNNTDNKHYANFGCAYQNNLAAQIANPADLLGPRQSSEIDTERRSISIEDYRARDADWDSEVDY